MLTKLLKLKKFLGPEIVKYLFFSIVVGAIWFLVESSFIFMIQGFLLAIGLLSTAQAFLPDWYPVSLGASVFMLILFGLLRALATMLKNHIGFLTQVSFTSQQRVNLLALGLKNAQAVSSKEVVSLFSEIISQSGNVVSNLSMAINISCSMILFFLSGLKLAPYEMMTGVTLLALFLFPLKYVTRKINSFGNGLVEEWENLSEALLRGLKNYFFLAIYNQVDTEIEKGSTSIKNYKKHYTNYSLIAGFATAFPMFIGLIILSAITFVSVRYIKTDAMKLVAFFYLFIRLAQSAGEASSTISNLRLNMPSLLKLYRWNEKLNAINSNRSEEKKEIENSKIEIKVENLSFNYEGFEPLFRNLDFKISMSDILVIKGESGAGKSTLLSIILGLNLPTSGEVKINSLSSKNFNLDLHKVLAYVGPEPYLIQGTVRENLQYGLANKKSIDDAELWDALTRVELKDLVQSLKLKLDEPINDIPQLSYGQRQRLSFARALIRKPSLLILDEATANLDLMTEKKIIGNLQELFRTCTSIVVTHKNSFDEIATQRISLGN